jgi:alkylated DNA repair dioxygenase AlkB
MDLGSGFVIIRQFLSQEELQKSKSILLDLYHSKNLTYEANNSHYKESFGGDHDYFENLVKLKWKQIQNLVSFKVKPENSYARIYRNGGVLKAHVDRKPLDITASVSLGGNLDDEWPICLIDLNGVTRCEKIYEGDAIVFLGNRMTHWREQLVCRPDQYTLKLFLHWVRE